MRELKDMTDLIYKIKTAHISEQQQERQNLMMIKALDAASKVVINSAPTGFGKTHLQLAIAKNNSSFIFTPTTAITFEFYKAHQLQQFENPSDNSLCFMIGKGQRHPVMCPFFKKSVKKYYHGKTMQRNLNKEEVKQEKREQNIYDFCKSCTDNLVSNEDKCPYFKETYSSDGLTQRAESMLGSILNYMNDGNKNYKFTEIIDKSIHLDLCPYELIKNAASRSFSKVCDFNFFIKKDFLLPITQDTRFSYAIIDEFDMLMERLEGVYDVAFKTRDLEKAVKTLEALINEQTIDAEGITHMPPQKLSFTQTCMNIMSRLNQWIIKHSENIKSEVVEVRFKEELNNNDNLTTAYLQYLSLNASILAEYIESDNHIRELDKTLDFFDSLKTISDFDVVYFIEKNDDEIRFERKAICFRNFFNNRMHDYDKIMLFSATPPAEEVLTMNFGENFIINEAEWFYKNRRGIIYVDKDFDLGGNEKKWFNDWQKKTDHLISILNISPFNENVVFLKSKKYLTGDAGKIVLNKCRKNGITPFACIDSSHHKELEIWQKYENSCKQGNKTVIFAASQGRWGRGVNKLKNNGCRFLIIWGIPIKHIPNNVIQNGYNREFRRQKSYMNFWSFWCNILPKSIYMQTIGRLVRNDDDYGFYTILTHKKINNILDSVHQRKLGCIGTTYDINELINELNKFYKEKNKSEEK